METNKPTRIEQISNDFYDDHFIQELEMRLETDPLFPGGLIDLIDEVTCNHTCGTNICQPNNCATNICDTNECRPNTCGTNGAVPPQPPVEGGNRYA